MWDLFMWKTPPSASLPQPAARLRAPTYLTLNGTPATVTEMLAFLSDHYPDAAIEATVTPCPSLLRRIAARWSGSLACPTAGHWPQGLPHTVAGFQAAKARGVDLAGMYQHTLGKTP
jgi:hypothetical protein